MFPPPLACCHVDKIERKEGTPVSAHLEDNVHANRTDTGRLKVWSMLATRAWYDCSAKTTLKCCAHGSIISETKVPDNISLFSAIQE